LACRSSGKALALLQEWATVVQPTVEVIAVEGDEDDNRILECCLECNAHYLITGDQRDLLPLQTFQGTRIVNAATFLRELAALELSG
jgi:predicted nucleic acid-binding protein